MKKVLAIIAIVMLVPFTAFGMEMMADTALEDVTGQAGVSIDVDNVQMDFAMDYLAWGDADATNDTDDDLKSWVGIAGLKMTNIVIDRLGFGGSGIGAIAADGIPGSLPQVVSGGTWSTMNGLSYLTIDVGLCPYPTLLQSTYGEYTSHTAVAIGIPTLTIYVGQIADMDIALDTTFEEDDATTTDIDETAIDFSAEVMGTLAIGGMQVDLKAGNVYIMAH